MACTSPLHPWQQLVCIHKKKRLDLKIKNWVQDLHYEKVKIKKTVALITESCFCKLKLNVWSFIRHENVKDGGTVMLFCSLKTNSMFHSRRKWISNNASFFVAVLQWLHQLMQQNENVYASKIIFFFFCTFYKQYPYSCTLHSLTQDIKTLNGTAGSNSSLNAEKASKFLCYAIFSLFLLETFVWKVCSWHSFICHIKLS